jgi:hypothetical protein
MDSSQRVSFAACVYGVALLFSVPIAAPTPAVETGVGPSAATHSVSVTPDAATAAEQKANTAGHVLTFTVTNTGGEADRYEVVCVGVARATCNGAIPGHLALSAGQSSTVDVSFSVAGAGTGLLSLVAVSAQTGVDDHGSFRVPVVP